MRNGFSTITPCTWQVRGVLAPVGPGSRVAGEREQRLIKNSSKCKQSRSMWHRVTIVATAYFACFAQLQNVLFVRLRTLAAAETNYMPNQQKDSDYPNAGKDVSCAYS